MHDVVAIGKKSKMIFRIFVGKISTIVFRFENINVIRRIRSTFACPKLRTFIKSKKNLTV